MEHDPGALWRDAEGRFAQGDLRRAAQLYETLVAAMPAHLPAWLRLSAVATATGRYRDAVACAARAAAISTMDTGLRIAVGERLAEVGETARAHERIHALATDSHLPAAALADLAFAMHGLGVADEALALAERAWAYGVRRPDLAYLRATLLLFAGKEGAAEAALEDVIRQAPELASAHWTLSKLRRWSDADNHVQRLQRELARLPSTHPSAAYLYFALFKELEDCGRDAEAWDALQRGCVAKRAQLRYDADAESRLYQQMVDLCTPAFFQQRTPAQGGPVPIFIVGQPRSGTTVLERILGAHPQVRDAGELDDFAHAMAFACDHQAPGMLDATLVARARNADFGLVGHRYLANTRFRARGRAFFTDKLPRNFAQVGFLHRALPQARILHMVRDPMDTCFSNLKELFGAAYPHSYDMREMARHFRHYRQLMAHWHAVLPGVVMDVSYADLVADPERVARAVFAHCGLEWMPGCVAIERREEASMTASAAQVREPIQQRYLGQWKRYERQLQPLSELLGD